MLKAMTNVVALVDATNKVVIQHKLGGEIKIVDTDSGLSRIWICSSNNS